MKHIIVPSVRVQRETGESSSLAAGLILESLHSRGLQGKYFFLNSFPLLPGVFGGSRAPAAPGAREVSGWL